MADPKTAKDTPKLAPPSPRNGNRLPLGNHPGNTGGKKGRSGAKPRKFFEHCIQATEDPKLWAAAREKQPLGTLGLAAEYTYGKPKQALEMTGDVTFRVVYDEESAPDREDA